MARSKSEHAERVRLTTELAKQEAQMRDIGHLICVLMSQMPSSSWPNDPPSEPSDAMRGYGIVF